jgi:hypothetical protein
LDCRQNINKNHPVPKYASKYSLLEKTCDLIRSFPEYFDVVVSVARKTDGRHWADLFSAAGRSTEFSVSFQLLYIFFIKYFDLVFEVHQSYIFRKLCNKDRH